MFTEACRASQLRIAIYTHHWFRNFPARSRRAGLCCCFHSQVQHGFWEGEWEFETTHWSSLQNKLPISAWNLTGGFSWHLVSSLSTELTSQASGETQRNWTDSCLSSRFRGHLGLQVSPIHRPSKTVTHCLSKETGGVKQLKMHFLFNKNWLKFSMNLKDFWAGTPKLKSIGRCFKETPLIFLNWQ